MKLYLGFDPGGKDKFGWAICSPKETRLQVLHTGLASHAAGALQAVKAVIPKNSTVVGVGIDAPLYWVANGDRRADHLIRKAVKALGAKSPGGTVQQVNSLRGACVAQGPLIASLIAREYPEATITESHPKALLYLLSIANKIVSPNTIQLTALDKYIVGPRANYSEDERDAVLGALTVWAPKNTKGHWKNLVSEESKVLVPFVYKPSYWMPWNLVSKDG